MSGPMVTQAASLMLEAMKDLRDKKLSPQEASAIAQLGVGIIAGANAEIQFIKATGALPEGGSFGTKIKFIEPGN